MRRLYRRLFEMRQFSERNPYVVGAIGIGVVVAAILLAVNYDKVPFLTGEKEYAAYFAEAGGLETNGVVEVSGARIGKVASVALDGPRVLVKFRIPGDMRLGDRTEAAVKVKNFLGTKVIELTPRGEGRLTGPIPLERTTPAYQLPDVLGDLSTTVTKLNTDQLSNALSVVAGEFSGTPPEVKAAVEGVARFSQTLAERDKELRNLLSNANKVTDVLAKRSDEIVKLVGDTNSLLASAESRKPLPGPPFRRRRHISPGRWGQSSTTTTPRCGPRWKSSTGFWRCSTIARDAYRRQSRGSTALRSRWAKRLPRVRSSRPTSSTWCRDSSFSRSSTPRSTTSESIPRPYCPRSSPTR